jgi:hypothetical protein
MRACARLVLVLIAVFASLGFAGCASIDELKDTMPDATDRRPPEKILGEQGKASNKKDRLGSKLQGPQTVELLKKSPVSVSTEAVRPQQGADPQSATPEVAPLRLHTPWPEAPAPGTFAR